jgi:predicted RNase H-like HicB family nuclease
MQYNTFNYPIKVFWSEEDEGYKATVPDLPGVKSKSKLYTK